MILCCGEALIDMLPRESTAGEPAFAPYPGGAVFNSAIALGRLGAPVEFFSGLSSDLFGDVLRQALLASNVGTAYAHVSARPTTLAFVRLTNGQAKYTFYDENTAGRMLTAADLPPLGPAITALLFGAISLIPEPCGSTYEALMTREHLSRVTMLDPNIRPGFIADPVAHKARMRRMVAMADIVKLSDEDMAWFGEAGTADEIAQRWLARGPKLILVTRGGDGATAYTARHKVNVPSRRVEVVDTVGAGDTFNAGVLASLHEAGLLTKQAVPSLDEAQIAAALDLGARAAAVTVSRAGANPPWRSEL
ncbi:MAG: carbohydrate kinase [Mesorhizobium sp.]|nr:carbohydrate kinase [Mesorhizobium sp.]